MLETRKIELVAERSPLSTVTSRPVGSKPGVTDRLVSTEVARGSAGGDDWLRQGSRRNAAGRAPGFKFSGLRATASHFRERVLVRVVDVESSHTQ